MNIPVYFNNIKLCKQFCIQLYLHEEITKEEMDVLKHYLKQESHNISILNCSDIPQHRISEIIKLLDDKDINYANVDCINFGYKKFAKKDFIIFGKMMLNQFSNNKDTSNFKLAKYLC